MIHRRPILALGVGIFLWVGVLLLDRWVEQTDLPPLLAETSVEVRDRRGALLRAYPVADGIWRLRVAPDQVDPRFLQMLIRYEDKRFYEHSGIDPRALMRAAAQAVWNGRAVSGGSTLTMQVARLLEDGTTGRWPGKLRQIRLALALERHLTKDEILTLYLTHAPYGGNLEGVRAATRAWFGKEPRRLTPAQSALLVALPQSPETRRPDRAPDRAEAARNRVATRLRHAGLISAEEQAEVHQAKIPTRQHPFPQIAAHLADRVTRHNPTARHLDLTVDRDLQQSLERLAAAAVRDQDPQMSVAILVADHHSGAVLASVGAPAYRADRAGFVDMTQAYRSPGSTLKPLVYGLAFDRGLAHPETLIHDGPVEFDGYAPQNFDGVFRGDLRLRAALQQSLNTPVVRLTQALGPARLMDVMRRGGVAGQLPAGRAGLAVALGGVGLRLSDLVQLYAGIAAGGQGMHLRYLQDAPETPGARMLSPVAAWYLGDILRDLPPPPGAQPRQLAYKTGTSYGHRDAWAIGWDGDHVIGVWMGRADGTPVPGAFGGDLAAPVLFQSFGRLKPQFAPLPAAPAAALTVTTDALPRPLQRFEDRAPVREKAEALQLLFPPDGANLVASDALTLKIQGGEAPFMVLHNGTPVRSRIHRRAFEIPITGQGFSQLVVVDRLGNSDRVDIRLH